MPKKVICIRFEEREELNSFLNKNKIPREDILGVDRAILTFYAGPELIPEIERIRREKKAADEDDWKSSLFIWGMGAVVIAVFVLIHYLKR